MRTFVHEEVYRTEELMNKIHASNLIICGVGAIGSNLVDNLSRQGFKNILVIDMDRVDDHNRNTQIYGRRDIGQLKTAALKNRVFTDMGVTVQEFSKKLDDSNIKKAICFKDPKQKNLVIDGFDNTESRQLVTDYCRKNKIECLHVGLFQNYAEVIWNEFYRVPKNTAAMDVCEYPLARNVVILASAVVSEVIVGWISTGVKNNYYITMKDLKISTATGLI
jgi:molybdopterin/thiamine biosynthesis adenylyltransferase